MAALETKTEIHSFRCHSKVMTVAESEWIVVTFSLASEAGLFILVFD